MIAIAVLPQTNTRTSVHRRWLRGILTEQPTRPTVSQNPHNSNGSLHGWCFSPCCLVENGRKQRRVRPSPSPSHPRLLQPAKRNNRALLARYASPTSHLMRHGPSTVVSQCCFDICVTLGPPDRNVQTLKTAIHPCRLR